MRMQRASKPVIAAIIDNGITLQLKLPLMRHLFSICSIMSKDFVRHLKHQPSHQILYDIDSYIYVMTPYAYMEHNMTDSEPLYLIEIRGPGMEFSAEVTLAKVANAISAVAGVVPLKVGSEISAPSAVSVPSDTYHVSLREFLDQTRAKKKIEQILAIAEWLMGANGEQHVSRDQIRDSFAQAREPLPANFPRDFNDVLKKGWLASVHGNKNLFYVTTTGKKALGDRL